MTRSISIEKIGENAKKASYDISRASSFQKNKALEGIMLNLKINQATILAANEEDIKNGATSGLSDSMIDRLSLRGRLNGIIDDIAKVLALPDPIGEIFESKNLDNGLSITKSKTPIGVLGVIYESRPNVTIDVSALSIKSGNCAILRGGSETIRTNQALITCIHKGLEAAQLPIESIQFISNPNRNQVKKLLRLHQFVDLIIPRGGAALHQFCRQNSIIPVITGGVGVCHLFIDETADLNQSLPLILNAKTQRPTVCNALDTLLVHEDIAAAFIPIVIDALSSVGVTFKLDPISLSLQKKHQLPFIEPAKPDDWDTEWLSLVLGIKVVKDLATAIEHIREHSTGHSDGILTQNAQQADIFVKAIDSAAVYVNASTRFTDGSQFGLGAEVAISTQKLHARGPVGLNELTSYKWIIKGDYSIRK